MKRSGVFGTIFFLVILEEGCSSDCDDCYDYLISGPRGIMDENLTASSVFPNIDGFHDPKYGRLHVYKPEWPSIGGWTPKTHDHQQYIQAAFSNLKLIRAIVTQGRSTKDQWVSSYSVSYSIDGSTWSTVKDVNKNTIIFPGNNDRSTIVTNTLPACTEARYVRLHPKTWHNYQTLRFDVIGCSKPDSEMQRRKKNWRRHLISLNPQIKQSLTQVFETSTQEIHVCAVKCQQNSVCQSFSLNQKSGKCKGYEKQIYQGDTASFDAQEDDVYFVSISQLQGKEYEIVESLNLCYKIITLKKTLASASAMCQEEKARLLPIRNIDEMKFVQTRLNNSMILSQQVHFYVDGSYKNELWVYATDEHIPTSLWSESHPVTGNGDCVTLTTNGLETHDCTDSLYFICGM